MSAETDFHALLVAHAPLTGLVGSRVALNAVAPGSGMPFVVFACTHVPDFALTGALLIDDVTFTVQCWAESGEQAENVADAVVAALPIAYAITSRVTAFDEDLDLSATVLTIQQWWQQ